MSRRFFSSIMILLLPVGLVVLLSVIVTQWGALSGNSTKLGPNTLDGVWTDIATFPAATVSATPGTSPLKIKRAAAVAYPADGKIYLLGGRHGLDGEDVPFNRIMA